MYTQSQVLECLYKQGFINDFSNYGKNTFSLSKKYEGKIISAKVCPQGKINGMNINSFLEIYFQALRILAKLKNNI
jgi:ribosomal protein S8